MTFSLSQLSDLGDLLRDAAREKILPRFRNLSADQIRSKSGPLDLVTDADEAAEAMITDSLLRIFPGCVVVGEEAATRDKKILNALADADLAFVVDPVDGTANFAAGLPLFGVMAAAIRHGEVIASAILDPVGDDIAFAMRGEGAWMETADGARRDLRVAQAIPVAQMSGSIAWRFIAEPLRSRVCGNFPKVAATWDYRCAAHEYRLLAAGSCDFLLFNRLLPWDHAPGWLLHHEAGGYSAQFDGSPYSPTRTSGGLICVSDRDSWMELRAALLE
jgi:fructose-1,6-bisphosphatase/inositol monophosphatase family enzyme